MTTPTKLKNYGSQDEDTKVIQLFYNGEVVFLITDKPVDIIASLRNWFDNIGTTYNYHDEDSDLLSDTVNYIKNEVLLLGWEVFHHNNIQKKFGFNIVMEGNDNIRVYYYEDITPSETWF